MLHSCAVEGSVSKQISGILGAQDILLGWELSVHSGYESFDRRMNYIVVII